MWKADREWESIEVEREGGSEDGRMVRGEGERGEAKEKGG